MRSVTWDWGLVAPFKQKYAGAVKVQTCSALQQVSALALQALKRCSALRQVPHHE